MRKWNKVFTMPAVLLLAGFWVSYALAEPKGTDKPSSKLSNPKSEIQNLQFKKAEVIQKTQRLQIPFIANTGQTDEQVAFYANTFGGRVFITNDGEIVYSLPSPSPNPSHQGRGIHNGEGCLAPICCKQKSIFENFWRVPKLSSFLMKNGNSLTSRLVKGDPRGFHGEETMGLTLKENVLNNPQSETCNPKSEVIALKETLVDGKVERVKGEAPSETRVNYFKGKDPSQWKTNILTYNVVTLGEVYRGIELKLKAYGNNIEKLFYVSPDADPEAIKIELKGTMTLKVNEEGQLVAETERGSVKFTKPVAYQEIDGRRVEVDAEYQIQSSGVRSQNTETNPSSQNSKIQNPNSENENVYGFKVAAYDRTKELIIDPLLASTYVGGSSTDFGNSIAIGSDGNIYVAGETESPDFPTTIGAYDTSYNSGSDAFVSKLSKDLTELLASTYLGGSEFDYVNSVVVDSHGDIYVTGQTSSSDFPFTSNTYDTSFNGGNYDTFVSKLSNDLKSLLASTYLGGSEFESVVSMVINSDGNIYVAGKTMSSDFPTTAGAYNAYGIGAFVSKFNGTLTTLLASTYLGYWGIFPEDDITSMAIDSGGNIYVTGAGTVGENICDGSWTWFSGGFILELNGDLTSDLASIYLGRNDCDDPHFNSFSSIVLDSDRNVYVTHYGSVLKLSAGLASILASIHLGRDAYSSIIIGSCGNIYVAGGPSVLKVDEDLTDILASASLEGVCNSISTDSGGNIYVAGNTSSSNFQTTSGAYDTSYNGGGDAFVSKFDSNLSAVVTPTPTASPTVTPILPCGADSIAASPKTMKLKREESDVTTITVVCTDGSPVVGEMVAAKIKSGRKRISVTPLSAATDVNGQAVFTITAKKTGNAKVKFKTDGGLKKTVTVKVRK